MLSAVYKGAQGPAVVEPRSPSRGNIVFSTLQGRILLNATKIFWSSSCRITKFMVLRLLTSESAGRITGIVNI